MHSRRYTLLALGIVANDALAAPCDIYAAAHAPCVAAHSTTRALYNSFNGPLYQVKRSDGQARHITPLSPGGHANSSLQDSFCGTSSCVISIIYDQSGHGNHLVQALLEELTDRAERPADANSAPVMLNGHKVYGTRLKSGIGYRCATTTGLDAGDNARSLYGVMDSNLMFDADYNELDKSRSIKLVSTNMGEPTELDSRRMNQMSMENGLYANVDSNQPSLGDEIRFVHTVLTSDRHSARAGDTASRRLSTYDDDLRSDSDATMHEQSAIIPGINIGNGAEGTFYEGAIIVGFSSDDTQNAVQANIVAAKYHTVTSRDSSSSTESTWHAFLGCLSIGIAGIFAF